MMFQLEVSNNYDGLDLEESSHIRVLCIYFHILKCSIYYLYGISWISHPSLTKKTICLNPSARNETLWQPLFVVDHQSIDDGQSKSFIYQFIGVQFSCHFELALEFVVAVFLYRPDTTTNNSKARAFYPHQNICRCFLLWWRRFSECLRKRKRLAANKYNNNSKQWRLLQRKKIFATKTMNTIPRVARC